MWCNEQLGRLQELLQDEFPHDAQILAVSTDSHTDSQKLRAGVKDIYGIDIGFPLLHDEGHKVIDRYGLLNMNTSPGPETRRYATPATYIIDKQGTVRWRMAEENWKLRPTGPVIIEALRRVDRGEDASVVTLESVSREPPLPTDQSGAAGAPRGGAMVLIAGGTFTMGQSGARPGGDSPGHGVELDPFYLDTREVSNAEYREFLAAIAGGAGHGHCHPGEPPGKDHTPRFLNDGRFNGDTLPVVGVDWYDAFAYAAWAGKALPTEAQWERAARSGVEGLDFPWGNEIDGSRANVNEEAGEADAVLADRGRVRRTVAPTGPKPVGSFPPNRLAIHDLIGNVEEWTADWYDAGYYRTAPPRNPPGPPGGVFKVVRGGSWHHAKGRNHTRYTHTPEERAFFLGFRCARPAPAGAR